MRLHRCRQLQTDAAIGQLQVRPCMRSGSAWGYHLQLQRGAHFKASVTELNQWPVTVAVTIAGIDIPMWASAVALVLAAGLTAGLWRECA